MPAKNQNPPPVDGRAASLYRRAALLVLPSRPPGADDPLLKARLSQEGPGLFNWALAGLHRLQARGRFEPPATVLQAAERLRLATSSPRDFVAQHCLLDPNARTQASHLIHAYRAWCDSQQIPAASPYVLAQHWRHLGFEHFKIDGCCYWGGVQLITADLSAVSTPPLAPELPSEPGHFAAFPP